VYDIVLLLGPLYHLIEESERIHTLEDCAAIVKPNGFIICAFVSKFAHLRDLAQKDPGRLSREKDFYEEYFVTGKYTRNPATVSHHTHPVEIQELFGKVAQTGVTVQRMVGCEGFLGGDLSKHLSKLSEDEYKMWVKFVMDTAEDSHVLSASDHIIVVAQKS
jgi:S-adenosylmethionine-dependent methyltransferase